MKRILAGLFFVFLFFSTGLTAHANKIILDPAHVRIEALPGESKSGSIKVDNPSQQEVKIKVYPQDWRYSSCFDGAKDFFPAGTIDLSCAKWIDFAPAEFTIPPFGRQVVNYTVRLPKDVRGGHFAVMFFETDIANSVDNDAGSSVNLKARLGALFSVEAKGALVCDAAFEDIKLSSSKAVLKISGNFKNIGNTDIAPKINFSVIDRAGGVFARGIFSDIFTLPQDSCQVSAETQADLKDGKYILVITLNLGRGKPKVLEVPISMGASRISVSSL